MDFLSESCYLPKTPCSLLDGTTYFIWEIFVIWLVNLCHAICGIYVMPFVEFMLFHLCIFATPGLSLRISNFIGLRIDQRVTCYYIFYLDFQPSSDISMAKVVILQTTRSLQGANLDKMGRYINSHGTLR